MKVALKGLRETDLWLAIIPRKPLIDPPEQVTPTIRERKELVSIFVKSIKTAEKNK